MVQSSLLSHFNNLKSLGPGFVIYLPEGASWGHHTTARPVCLIPAMPRITTFTRWHCHGCFSVLREPKNTPKVARPSGKFHPDCPGLDLKELYVQLIPMASRGTHHFFSIIQTKANLQAWGCSSEVES